MPSIAAIIDKSDFSFASADPLLFLCPKLLLEISPTQVALYPHTTLFAEGMENRCLSGANCTSG